MSPVPRNDIPQDLRLVIDDWGVAVVGHREIDYATQYRLERGSESLLLNVYTTGRVIVQGQGSGLKDLLGGRIAALQEKRAASRAGRSASRPALDGTPRVGIDEAGKGDYFGPLVVAGVRITGKGAAEKLQEVGVRDSKAIGDIAVRAMADRVLEAAEPHVGPGRILGVEVHPLELHRLPPEHEPVALYGNEIAGLRSGGLRCGQP